MILKIIFSNGFLRSIIEFYLFILFYFSKHIIMRNRRPEQEIILKDIGNLFRQKNP